jgi:hypothetical protein
MRHALIALLLFQVVWLSCAIGAGYGLSWPGICAATVAVAWHLASTPNWRRASLIVLATGASGLFAESLLVGAGVIRYSAAWPTDVLAPAWIVGLWLAFGTTLKSTRQLLGTHPIAKSILLGLLLGPLSYLAGQRLGALTFVARPIWPSYLAISAVWGVAYPALLAMEGRLARPSGSRRNEE